MTMTENGEKKYVSKGVCRFCNKSFAKSGISRHLAACKARKSVYAQPESGKKAGGARTGRLFHLQAADAYGPLYWMHFEIPASATLGQLDRFLRDIWLECCGHLSMFKIGQQAYSISPMIEYGDRNMRDRLDKVLNPGIEFAHEYDFGTTTYLTLRVVAEREGLIGTKGEVSIMARNDPPEIMCESCGKSAATQVCAQCIYYDRAWYCDECAPGHECGLDMMLPVVNSPRVGMCGYTGDAQDWF